MDGHAKNPPATWQLRIGALRVVLWIEARLPPPAGEDTGSAALPDHLREDVGLPPRETSRRYWELD